MPTDTVADVEGSRLVAGHEARSTIPSYLSLPPDSSRRTRDVEDGFGASKSRRGTHGLRFRLIPTRVSTAAGAPRTRARPLAVPRDLNVTARSVAAIDSAPQPAIRHCPAQTRRSDRRGSADAATSVSGQHRNKSSQMSAND